MAAVCHEKLWRNLGGRHPGLFPGGTLHLGIYVVMVVTEEFHVVTPFV